MIHERETDETARREVLVAQQRMLRRFADILHQQRFTRGRHAAGHAFANANAHALHNIGRNATGCREVQMIGLRRTQHE